MYAEDDADDQHLMQDVLNDLNPGIELYITENGKDAFEFLQDLADGSPLPSLIILDLNMPVWDGMETLRKLKSTPSFSTIPVCLFTTTSDSNDRQLALSLGAHAFVTKPGSYRELETIIDSFTAYLDEHE